MQVRDIEKQLRKAAHLSAALLFPRRCAVCDAISLPAGNFVCDSCRGKIRYIEEPICYRCGKRLADEDAEYCHDCRNTEHLYIKGYGLYEYESMKQSIYRFKYRKRQEYAVFYGQEVKNRLGSRIEAMKAQAFVPIPLHKSKRRSRGYNQSELLANELGKQFGIPVKNKLLVRVKKTVPQKELNPSERQNNLKKAFKIEENDVKLKTIILVDDIYTTGSTIDAASEVLLAGGIEKIYYISLAIGAGL